MPTDAELLDAAAAAAENAYAPYSRFRVGAVVVTDGGTFPGANVENAVYGSTLCAEAVAIGHAAASGVRSIDTVAVACLDAGRVCHPCGNCRQLMREFGVRRILVRDEHGRPQALTLEELLPRSFGPEDLAAQ